MESKNIYTIAADSLHSELRTEILWQWDMNMVLYLPM